jgi:hypothetical protein
LDDALIARRTDQVVEQLSEIFVPQVLDHLKPFAQFSKAVKELERDRAVFVSARQDLGLDAARKTREVFDILTGYAKETLDLEVAISSTWLTPIEAPGITEPIEANALGALA